ncbi:cell wall hydrolase [uncultured Algimonas sp.]|uniref:cell wall hydrolase n=1 Tax=uncultured Algimonas sp. TaxID=1547920 RepID=UPI00262A5B4B|nr:cell wall hydrolase [uncultured Algimonas sp.]
MKPKQQMITGWAVGLAVASAGAVALPAAAEKAADQRTEFVTTNIAKDFRRMPEPKTDLASVSRLAELYGPDSLARTPLERVRLDNGSFGTDISTLRKQSEASMREANCLAEAVYYEARGESRKGQIAVAQVVQNRVLSKHYPDTICGVVYQGSERTTGCQFSFTCDGSMKKAPKGRSWTLAKDVARYVSTETPRSLVGVSTHYHTDYVDPRWNRTLRKTKQVGSHIFYRFPFTEVPRADKPTVVASLRIAPPS